MEKIAHLVIMVALICFFSCGDSEKKVADPLQKGSLGSTEIKNFGYFVNQKENSQIDSLLALADFKGFNGNILLLDDGKIIYKNCLGYANFETRDRLNDSTVFELASCTKQFTAMAIMILAEQGKLKYSDTLQKFIPDLPYEGITVEHLLTHTAGLPEYGATMHEHWDSHRVATNGDIVNVFKTFKPERNQAPDIKFEYSNTGYVLLSIIIEKASGMSYSEFLDQAVFKPLGMRHSLVSASCNCKDKRIENYACGYNFDTTGKYILTDSVERIRKNAWLGGITGDRAVHSTISDLARWDKALREYALVNKSTLDKAFTPHVLKDGTKTDYGFGQFIIRDGKNREGVFHAGAFPGYRTCIVHFTTVKTTIVLLSNTEFENTLKLAGKIKQIHLGK